MVAVKGEEDSSLEPTRSFWKLYILGSQYSPTPTTRPMFPTPFKTLCAARRGPNLCRHRREEYSSQRAGVSRNTGTPPIAENISEIIPFVTRMEAWPPRATSLATRPPVGRRAPQRGRGNHNIIICVAKRSEFAAKAEKCARYLAVKGIFAVTLDAYSGHLSSGTIPPASLAGACRCVASL